MTHKVTVYSNWEKTSVHEFETLEEAELFAENMKHNQYSVLIDVIDIETDEEHRYNKL
jgi:hypothetical protein